MFNDTFLEKFENTFFSNVVRESAVVNTDLDQSLDSRPLSKWDYL